MYMTIGDLSRILWGILHSLLQIGRPVVYGLAVEGEAGVSKVLQMLRDELELTMSLVGCC